MIRTRFAPSPTGFMHVGGVRTALFAWLLAKKSHGVFLLRIEDTDKAREVEGSIKQIEESLQWLGIEWDEGIDKGGDYGPYLQSERLSIYHEWAKKLLANGRAYVDPYSKDQLEQFRLDAKNNKKPFLYREYRPDVSGEWDGTRPLRFKSDPKSYMWNDAVMGQLSAGPEVIDDFIIIKGDGYPTYNFCHIIDDMLMNITHVLRSSEFISSTPKFLNLYEALDITPPVLATLPYVMAIDGKKKLGKRDGAKDILSYANDGYLPEAMVNFLATLGWNDGTEQEVYSLSELVNNFSLDRIQNSPARFDEQRLLWLNGQHIRKLSLDDLYTRVSQFWPESASNADKSLKLRVLELLQDRLKTLSDVTASSRYFFETPTPKWSMLADNKQLKKLTFDEQKSILTTSLIELKKSQFDPESLQSTLNYLLEKTNQKPGSLFSLLRLVVSWSPFSPALNETLSTLGKEAVSTRIKLAIDTLPEA